MISIIIPVFNSAKYLQRCLYTVLNQDYTDIEVILVDDGSTDGSGHLCDEYPEKDQRIRVIHQQNQGASIARQEGLRQARGEYVTFVDSDDWITKDYISTLYTMIIKHHTTISACDVQRVKENEIIKNHEGESHSVMLSFDVLMPRFFKYEFWGFPGKLYKKNTLEQISFPEATLSEDYLVMTHLFIKERQIAYTATSLYFYEYHSTSLSHQKLSKRAFEEYENVKAVYELIKVKEPQYTDMALANVVETCIKLTLMVLYEDNKSFSQKYNSTIRSFIKRHFSKILLCKSLSWKTKILITCLHFFPWLTAIIYRNYK